MHTITYYSMIGIVRSDKAPVPNVDISYLPKCTEFFKQILENKSLFLN